MSVLWAIGTVVVVLLVVWLLLTRTTVGRGFAVPLRTIFSKPVTRSYPEEKPEPAPRFHGRHQLNRYEDGLERCIGCELCAWACPADAIFVLGADNTEWERYSPGERYAEDYQINYSRCILCGLCIEACPTRALTMTHEYEFAADNRADLLWSKGRLLVPQPDGTAPLPHTDTEVRARGINYYGGLAVSPPLLAGGEYAQAVVRPMTLAGDAVGDLTTASDAAPLEDEP